MALVLSCGIFFAVLQALNQLGTPGGEEFSERGPNF